MLAWLKRFRPQAMTIPRRDYWLSPLGAFLGLVITELISYFFLNASNPWFIAPMGASALLLFVFPASPLAQPWPMIGGHLVAALIGVSCAKLLGNAGWVACLAVAISILGMMHLRCLHPPSGAVALTAVLGGVNITQLGYGFVLFPVFLNSFLLLVLAIAFNNLFGRKYPHQVKDLLATPVILDVVITRQDIVTVLKKNQELLDISEDDIESIIIQAELNAKARQSSK